MIYHTLPTIHKYQEEYENDSDDPEYLFLLLFLEALTQHLEINQTVARKLTPCTYLPDNSQNSVRLSTSSIFFL